MFSNTFFLALRACKKHKIELEDIPEKKKLPVIDTIIAIQEVTNSFNGSMVPFIVSLFLYLAPNGTNTGFLFIQLTIILASAFI